MRWKRWMVTVTELWEDRSVESLCTRVTSGGTPRRQVPGYYLSHGEGTPWVKTKELDDRWLVDAEEWISNKALAESSAKVLPTNTVLMAMYGATVGKLGILASPMACNQASCAMIVDPAQADYRYLFYRLLHDRPQLVGLANGAAQQNLSAATIKTFSFPCPPLDEQRRIAEVLGALDDLIDTNDRTCDSLVALNNAEFDRRFGLRSLGPTVGELAKVVDCLHSKKPEQSAEGGRLLLQLNNIRDDGLMDLQSRYVISEKDYALWSKNLETKPLDLVVTNVGRVGAVARVPVGLTAALGRNMTAVRANDPVGDAAFITAALLSSAVRREIENKTDSGTILNALNVRSIPKLRLQDSTPDERTRFSEWALPLLEMCDSLVAHNAQLRRTRDELLPLLMSGAVRVRPEEVAA